MSLIAVPLAAGTAFAAISAGDARTMRTKLERLFAIVSPVPEFLADFDLDGAGAGALWTAQAVFVSDQVEITPIAPNTSLLVRVVVAPDEQTLNLEINRAGGELAVAGALWLPKIVVAGGGSGAVWMGIVLGSTAPRPTTLPCDCPPPPPPVPRLIVHADNGGATLNVDIAPLATALATTVPVVVAAGQQVLIWARIFYHVTAPGALFSGIIATPTAPPGPPIFVDGTANSPVAAGDQTVTFAGADAQATSTPPLPPNTYIFTLQGSVTGGAVAVVDGFPPAVVPGAQLTIEVV